MKTYVKPRPNNFDTQHSHNLSRLGHRAQMGTDKFAEWARRSEAETDQVYTEILAKLGTLPIHKPWEIFAKIYDEDTPDNLSKTTVEFADRQLRRLGMKRDDLIVDVACGTGTVARLLTKLTYTNIIAFDTSSAMLSQAYRLCAHIPTINILESDISTLSLPTPASAMIWLGYSSNYAMTKKYLNGKFLPFLQIWPHRDVCCLIFGRRMDGTSTFTNKR